MLRRARRRAKGEEGVSLLEVLIAAMIFLVGATGHLGTITMATLMNASHGAQGTRATEYAVAKMEQLMALPFSNITYDTRYLPTVTSNGSGLGGPTASTTYPTGGNLSLVNGLCPTANVLYCDYIVQATSGDTVSPSSSGAAYIRQWQIVVDSTGYVKTITVKVTSLSGLTSIAPSTTLVSQKTNYNSNTN